MQCDRKVNELRGVRRSAGCEVAELATPVLYESSRDLCNQKRLMGKQ